uniref:Uncharacterized protein n=1 Tax=Arundo donax TaxID=35708 RepID=A0A0A9ABN9_ARUDO
MTSIYVTMLNYQAKFRLKIQITVIISLQV